MQCQNVACEKRLSPEKEGFHTCSLCNTPMYCSNACRVAGWADHNCKNVIHVESSSTPTSSFARPYYFEDFLTQEEIDSLPINSPVFDAFSLASYDGNRLVKQWYEPPIVEPIGGEAVSKDYSKGKLVKYTRGVPITDTSVIMYDIDVFVNNVLVATLEGTPQTDMIYDKNANTAVKEVSNLTRQKNENNHVFWPFNSIDKQNIKTDLEFEIYVALRVGQNPKEKKDADVWIRGAVKLDRQKDKYFRNLSKNLLSNVKKQLTAKFKTRKNIVPSIDNLVVRRLTDLEENSVVLTFDMTTGSKPRLVDVELEVPVATLRGVKSEIPEIENQILQPIGHLNCFKCDPKDTDMVIGLGMALDELLVTMPRDNPNLERLEKSCAVIKQYAHFLEENKGIAPDYVSNEICANIDAVVDVMFIEAKTMANMKKLSLNLDEAKRTVDAWEMSYKEKKRISRGIAWTQMKFLRSYLNHNMKVAQKNIDPQEYQTLIKRIDALLKRK